MPMLSANSCSAVSMDASRGNRGTYLGHCVLYGTLISHIALVADQKLVYALGGVAIDFLEPLLDVVE